MSAPASNWMEMCFTALAEAGLGRDIVGKGFLFSCAHLGQPCTVGGIITGFELSPDDVNLFVSVTSIGRCEIKYLSWARSSGHREKSAPWTAVLTDVCRERLHEIAGAFDNGVLHIL